MSSDLVRHLSLPLPFSRSSPRRHQHGIRFLFSVLFVLISISSFGSGPREAQAAAIIFSLDTTTLSGTDARLDFQLIDGDVTDNSSVDIANITTNGTLQSTDCPAILNCTGGPPFTITDTGGLGLFAQLLNLGSSLSFTLTSTLGTPDLLSVNLLNPNTNFSLVATDLTAAAAPIPYQDALLVLNLSNGSFLLPTSSSPSLSVSAVPEPSTLMLAMLGFSLLAWKTMRPQLAADKEN
jgi:hypothetical protein